MKKILLIELIKFVHAFPHKSRALIQRAIESSKVKRKDGTELEPKTKIFPEKNLF